MSPIYAVARDLEPQSNLILTLKWLIEGDEQAYLSTANWVNRMCLGDGGLAATPGSRAVLA